MGRPWKDIEPEIIADMRKRARNARLYADEQDRKADEFEKRYNERQAVVLNEKPEGGAD
jgi:predicted PolB exonuclease-like 3'-5' exonuclease